VLSARCPRGSRTPGAAPPRPNGHLSRRRRWARSGQRPDRPRQGRSLNLKASTAARNLRGRWPEQEEEELEMAASLFIEQEHGTYTTPFWHPHNGYYAGDFSQTSRPVYGAPVAQVAKGQVAEAQVAEAQVPRPAHLGQHCRPRHHPGSLAGVSDLRPAHDEGSTAAHWLRHPVQEPRCRSDRCSRRGSLPRRPARRRGDRVAGRFAGLRSGRPRVRGTARR
jgi:hypothetical protein